MAVDGGTKIGVLATLPTSSAAIGRTITDYAKTIGKQVEIVRRDAVSRLRDSGSVQPCENIGKRAHGSPWRFPS